MKQLIVEKVGKFGLAIFICSVLVGVGPPPDGTTVDVKIGGGVSQFQKGRHRTRHAYGQAGIVHRLPIGLSVGLSGAGSGEKVLESSLPDDQTFGARRNLKGEVYGRYAGKGALGWHSDYFGGELGIGLAGTPKFGFLFPSIELWGGEPKKLYAFLSILGQPILPKQSTAYNWGVWWLAGRATLEAWSRDNC